MKESIETDKKADFGFTAYVWHEVYAKIKLFEEVKDLIIQNFYLKKYSSQVHELIFAFQISPPPRFFDYQNYFSYKKGIIFLYGKIDYQTFWEASPQQALTLMCQAYLDAILTIPSLRGMKKVQFDTEKLYQDLKGLFIEKGILL